MRLARTLITGFLVMVTQLAGAVDYTNLPSLKHSELEQLRLTDMVMCGERLLAVGERGSAIYSDDGGELWRQGEVPVSQLLTAVVCLPDGRAWAVGHGGVILVTDNLGESWTLQFDGDQANQQWLEYVKRYETELAVRIEILGDEADADLEYALEDATFAIEDAMAAIETGPADPLLDIWFRDENYGIAVGAYGMIYRTRDSGENWQLMAGNIENSERYHYYSLAAATDGTLYLSGEAGLMFRSDDGGEQWQRLETGYDGSLFGVLAGGGDQVLSFGLRGNILRSEDRGLSWQTIVPEANPAVSLYGGDRLAGGELVLVGAAGTVLQSEDEGLAFQVRQLSSRSTLSAVVRNSDQRLLVVGMSGLESVQEDSQ